jgi:hypothetical protein
MPYNDVRFSEPAIMTPEQFRVFLMGRFTPPATSARSIDRLIAWFDGYDSRSIAHASSVLSTAKTYYTIHVLARDVKTRLPVSFGVITVE